WARAAGWNPARANEALGDVLLAASTEKLAIISGGEYLGKDDPVLLAVEPLANALNLFMRDRFCMTQGDGRGSHNMFPTPLAFGESRKLNWWQPTKLAERTRYAKRIGRGPKRRCETVVEPDFFES